MACILKPLVLAMILCNLRLPLPVHAILRGQSSKAPAAEAHKRLRPLPAQRTRGRCGSDNRLLHHGRGEDVDAPQALPALPGDERVQAALQRAADPFRTRQPEERAHLVQEATRLQLLLAKRAVMPLH